MEDPLNILHTVGFDALYPIIRAELTLRTALDTQRFLEAVDQVQQVVPQLTCRYQLTNNQFVPLPGEQEQTVHLVNRADEEVARQLDWERGPQWQLYLSPTKLVIYISHILTDGAGFKELLYLLAQAYRGEEISHLVNHTDIVAIRHLLTTHRSQPKENDDHPAHPLSLPALAGTAVDSRRYEVIHTKLSQVQFAHLHQTAKAAGLTINDVTMAAFGKAVQQFCETEQLALACPTDMRQYLAAPTQTELRVQNLTGRYNVQIPARRTDSVFTVASRLHTQMVKQKAELTFLESFRSMLAQLDQGASLAALQAQVEANYHVRDIAYTNLAIIDRRKLDFGGEEIANCFITGGFRQMPRYQIAVSSFAGELTLAANVIGTPVEIKLAQAVMEMMRLMLLTFTERGGFMKSKALHLSKNLE